MSSSTPPLRIGATITVLAALAFAAHEAASSAQDMRHSWPVEEHYVTLPPTQAARFASLGYNELSADITWARTLVYYGSGFLGEGDYRYLDSFVRNIMVLDPKFKKLYEWASYAITVNEKHQISTEADNIKASIEILEQAMVEFPDDYEFFWLAGVRYFLDLKSSDPEEQRSFKEHGAELMEMAMRKPGAPKNLANKAAAFRSLLGQNERAQENLMQMIMTTDDKEAQASMLRNFRAVAGDEVANELALAKKQLESLRSKDSLQYPKDIFVLLNGPKPSPVINFDALANERDLVGTGDDSTIELFPE